MANLTSQLRLTLQDQVTGRMRGISAALSGFQARTRALSAPMMGVTSRLLALGAGYFGVAAGVRGTLGAAIKFEEAFADVRKVVNASDEQFANFSRTMAAKVALRSICPQGKQAKAWPSSRRSWG